jgi:Icc-related predicted phosphoesterase
MNECTVALAGDWHGNHDWSLRCIDHLASLEIRTIYHLGDFGLWHGRAGRRYWQDIDKLLQPHAMRLLVTPGNHENYDILNNLTLLSDDGDGHGPIQWLTDHIAFLPRGTRWTVNGWEFCSVGGAPSLDFEQRTAGIDWWPAEAITSDDVEQAVAAGPCDVLLTHDSANLPWVTPQVARILTTNPNEWSREALAYAADGSQHVTELLLQLRPVLHVHGHMHVRGDHVVDLPEADEPTRIISLDCDGQPNGNLALLTLPPKAYGQRIDVTWLKVPSARRRPPASSQGREK